MKRPVLVLLGTLAIAGCAARPAKRAAAAAVRPPAGNLQAPVPDDHVPIYARQPFEPFAREEAVAIAEREWRLFGAPIDDVDPRDRPEPEPWVKPERWPGLWERVGEYWWTAMWPGMREAQWTGKHNAEGGVFPPAIDGNYAWSAAFISYVMRVAGAGTRFPYSINHSGYINAALTGGYALRDQRLTDYAPMPGDLICEGVVGGVPLTFDRLPADGAGHCDMVVALQAGAAAPPTPALAAGQFPLPVPAPARGAISVIGGNVDDAVTLKHVPVTADGKLADQAGTVLDTRYPWFVVVQVLYDVDSLPDADLPPAPVASN
ncbi:MAG TPA: DUF2272 domain-containing protein [Acetobacteraceae bacterium]|nr:DUF2272 domain-containing protein [Acetobacteraceae bacterium]